MKAYVFPGQGAQFTGMGKDLYDQSPLAHDLFEKANEILGFRITDIMFTGSAEDLRQTKVTQPAIFLHSVLLAKTLGADFKPEMVAGHSLGEFSALVAAGAKRALKLSVGGAFHSSLMEPARVELAAAIEATPFTAPVCPIYQNVNAKPQTDPTIIKANLVDQLTSPVRWTQSVLAMVADGADAFTELGPGAVLQGLIKKISKDASTDGMQ